MGNHLTPLNVTIFIKHVRNLFNGCYASAYVKLYFFACIMSPVKSHACCLIVFTPICYLLRIRL